MLEIRDRVLDGEVKLDTLEVIRPEDVVIAIFGTTGAGKSTFIANCTKDRTPHIGHGLASCTTQVSVHTMRILGRTVHLIDTPSFNDTLRSDAETFQELAYWLGAAYDRKLQLSGVVFLHRITDIRFHSSTRRTLDIFKALCGKDAFCGTVVATTMWNRVATNEIEKAQDRQAQLKTKLQGNILASGGRLVPVSAAEVDPYNIVRHLVQKDLRLDLAFQKELSRHGCRLHQTAAGKIVYESSLASFEAMKGATHSSTQEMAAALVSLQATHAETQLAWEKRIDQENQDFEHAMQKYRDRLRSRDRGPGAPSSVHSSTELRRPPEPLSSSTNKEADASNPVYAELESEMEKLQRQHDAIVLRQRRKLDQRSWVHGRGTTTLGVVGTGLAVGQLVAAMACSVM
ncbi:hypothetical protein SVAN01_07257 [Stagonosporopsis vannaccii]|nr:hypothetical protein SVAN01_07257 [Stagonosporopsis vannaccii]